MSVGAYMLAVRDAVGAALYPTYTPTQLANVCEVMYDGMPKPNAGQEFWAVHYGAWSGTPDDAGLTENYRLQVTYSRRNGVEPLDRWGITYAKTIEPRLRQVLVAIHHSYVVMQAANAYIGPSFEGLSIPVMFVDGGSPKSQGPAWWSSEIENPRVADTGMSQTLTFAGAYRSQPVESED